MGPATAEHLEVGGFQTTSLLHSSSTTPNRLQQTVQEKLIVAIYSRRYDLKKSQEDSAGFLKKKKIYLAKSSFPCARTRLRTRQPGEGSPALHCSACCHHCSTTLNFAQPENIVLEHFTWLFEKKEKEKKTTNFFSLREYQLASL